MAIGVVMVVLCACTEKFDKEGRLIVDHLTSSGSAYLNFKPMMRTDSESVAGYKPDTFYLGNKRFTGPVVFYDSKERLGFTGYLKNGLADSSWKFYYASGGVRMEGWYANGWDIGMWRSYYGYNKPKIDKFYDDYGYMLMRIEYFDNGQVKNYQNVKSPLFDDKERSFAYDRHGDVLNVYVEDSMLMLKNGPTTERIGKNVFAKKQFSNMEVVK